MQFTFKKNLAIQLVGLVGLVLPYVNLDAVQAVIPPAYQLPFQILVGAVMGGAALVAHRKNPDGTSATQAWEKPRK